MKHDPPMKLVWPSLEYLPAYVAALDREWPYDNVSGREAVEEARRKIASDPASFVVSLVDRRAEGDPFKLPDGSVVPRLPGFQRWLWDGEFCGTINLRWQPGTEALPAYVPGHIGYSVVTWKRRRGYATRALRLLLPDAKAEGLRFVEITTDPDNVASRRVIEANGGTLVEEFIKPDHFGGTLGLRYRISLESK